MCGYSQYEDISGLWHGNVVILSKRLYLSLKVLALKNLNCIGKQEGSSNLEKKHFKMQKYWIKEVLDKILGLLP